MSDQKGSVSSDVASDPVSDHKSGVYSPLEEMSDIQDALDAIQAQDQKRIATINDEYWNIYRKLYSKRSAILNGGEMIPGFWLTAMKHHLVLSSLITKDDEEALQYLNDIKLRISDNSRQFNILFKFSGNPFFKNRTLSTTFRMIDNSQPTLQIAIGTKIEWINGKCLTADHKQCPSFFDIFVPPEVPMEGVHIGRTLAMKLQKRISEDYKIGDALIYELIPHAYSWYTGEAAHEEYLLGMYDDADDDDDDDADDDYDDADDDYDDDEDADVVKTAAAAAAAADDDDDNYHSWCTYETTSGGSFDSGECEQVVSEREGALMVGNVSEMT